MLNQRDALAEWREHYSLRLEQIAGEAGVSGNTVRTWLDGSGPLPRVDQIAALERRWPGLAVRLFPESTATATG